MPGLPAVIVAPMRMQCMPALIAGILTIAAAVAADLPDVEAAIPAPVKALGQPAML